MEKSLEAQNPRKVGTQPMENSQEYYPYRVHTQCWNPPYWGRWHRPSMDLFFRCSFSVIIWNSVWPINFTDTGMPSKLIEDCLDWIRTILYSNWYLGIKKRGINRIHFTLFVGRNRLVHSRKEINKTYEAHLMV